jgi:hypothetical protein
MLPSPKRPSDPNIQTSDQLRAAIDGGAAADKVAFPDPAAAPLGTDDEAAGTPPARRQIKIAARRELARGPRTQRSLEGFPWPYLAIGLVVVAAIFCAEFAALHV